MPNGLSHPIQAQVSRKEWESICYILDGKPIGFENGDLIKIYDKDGNLKCTLKFKEDEVVNPESKKTGKFSFEDGSMDYLKSILTTK